jgi:hypothetical protein
MQDLHTAGHGLFLRQIEAKGRHGERETEA